MRERYAELLKLKGLKGVDITKNVGIPSSTLSEWKKGKYELGMDKIVAIANYLDVSLDYFVLGKEAQSNELLTIYNELNEEGQQKLMEYANDILATGQYIKSHKSDMASA